MLWETVAKATQALRSFVGPKPKVTKRLVSRVDTEVQLFEELGSGRFGVCRRGILRNSPTATTAEPVAVKSIIKSRASMHDMRNELQVLERLKNAGECNNIIHLLDAFEDKSSVFMVTPLYSGGELFDRISQQRTFTEADASQHMLDLLNAIRFCHENNIVHRDVKPENLLFANKAEPNLVLVDFGMSRICEDKEEEMELQCGSPSYVAPEVLNRNYTMKCDLWSCGIILHILLVGGTPFGNGTDEEILTRVEHFNNDVFLHTLEQPEWANVSVEAKALCASLLTKDANMRPNAQQCYDMVLKWNKVSKARQPVLLTLGGVIDNLKQFNSMRRLKKATIHFIAEMIRNSSSAEREKQAEAMQLAHAISELKLQGRVKMSTLAEKLNLPGLASTTSSAAAGEQTVDVKDLVASALTKSVLLDEEYLLAAFKKFDVTGDGLLDCNDLAHALGKDPHLDKELVMEAMRHADTDKDGMISYDEFANSLRERSFTSETLKKRELTFTV